MSLAISATFRRMSLPTRAVLFGGATVFGFLSGYGWWSDASNFAYNTILTTFVDPGARIEPMAMGVGLAFLLGIIHITSI